MVTPLWALVSKVPTSATRTLLKVGGPLTGKGGTGVMGFVIIMEKKMATIGMIWVYIGVI